MGEEENIMFEVGELIRVCVYLHLRGPVVESQTSSNAVCQHSFMLLVLSQPWRDTTLLGLFYARLSNVIVMSFRIKRFHFIAKLIVV